MGLRLRCLILCLVLGLGAGLRGEVTIGMSREALIAELGRPTAVAARGNREILNFPLGVRIVLRQGVVAEIEGYPPDPSLLEPPITASHVSAQSLAAPTPAPAGDAPRPSSLAETSAKVAGKWPPPVPDWRVLAGLGVELFVQYLLTVLVVRITVALLQIEALWSGINAIASIDFVLQTVATVGIVWLTGNLRYGIVGALLPGVAMLLSVPRYCFDEHRNRSANIALVAKTFSVSLYIGFLVAATRFNF